MTENVTMLAQPEAEIRQLLSRVVTLEAQSKRLRRLLRLSTTIVASVFALSVAIGSGWADSDPTGDETATLKLLRAEALEIVDPHSQARIKLSAKYKKPEIMIEDERGKERVSLGLSPSGSSAPDETPGLWFHDSEGNLSICIRADDYPFIIMRDEHNRNRLRLSVYQKKQPMIEILDQDGEKAVWRAP